MFVCADPGLELHVAEHGDPTGRAVLFAHALGLDLHLWDAILPLLPSGLRLVTLDMRGHGQSSVPEPPYAMGMLIRDVETVCDTLGLRDCVVVGNSIGGLIAQGLAAKRLDLVRALMLSGTAPKIGTRAWWEARAASVASGGVATIAEEVLARWFARSDTALVEKYRPTLLACDAKGYAGCAQAIGGTDFYTTTAALRLPTLVTAGTEDGSTPPDLVRELAELIPGAEFHLLRGSGHLPAADRPEAFAALLTGFLERIGHV